MSDEDVRRMLSAAVGGEPPLGLDREAVFAEGRRRLRVRRTATVGGAAVAVVAVVLGMSALSGAQFGLREDVGPAAPAPATTSGSASTTSPLTSPPAVAPEATVTASPPTTDRLGAVLRDAKIPWPRGVAVEGEGKEWFAFDQSGTATFNLVAKDAARRLLTVRVYPGGAPEFVCREGCRIEPAPDRTLVAVRHAKPTEAGGPIAVEVMTMSGTGRDVQVVETAGFGPPWRVEPLLPDDVLVAIATIPGLAGGR
ncbi:hypothetical protein ACFPM7_01715 [Actinokineospora guangxiensis]|uniref:Uncharacterized protein n=1 Tax=Actinokineospora guangxiensis TaxID=1490288 RepID=A0ABW0EIC6_9PSEU